MSDSIMDRCEAIALRMTGQRRIIAGVLEESDDHPDVEELYARASALDAGISIATVYRTVKLFEEAGILERQRRVAARPLLLGVHVGLLEVGRGEASLLALLDHEAAEQQLLGTIAALAQRPRAIPPLA